MARDPIAILPGLVPPLLLGCLLSSAALAEGEETARRARSVLVMDLTANSIDAGTVDAVESILADGLARRPGLKVVRGKEVRQLLELEAEKQVAGCETDASCLAELAGALGAELVVTGQVAKLDSLLVLTLNLTDVRTVESVGRARIEVEELSALPAAIDAEIPRFVARVTEVSPPPATAVPPMTPWATYGVIGGALAVAVVGGGVAIFLGVQTTTSAAVSEARGRLEAAATPVEAVKAREDLEAAIRWHDASVGGLWVGTAVAAAGLAVATGAAGSLLFEGME